MVDSGARLVELGAAGLLYAAGWRIEVHGWAQKKPRARWECRTVDVS